MTPTPPALRLLTPDDRSEINRWPSYPPPYEKLDYALRPRIGWLDTHTKAIKFGVWQSNHLVAFTLLEPNTPEISEFYIAVHPAMLGEGIGRAAARATLQSGFREHGLARIFLRVRINHTTGIQLYEELGFERTGTFRAQTNGEPVEFFRMDLPRDRWERLRPTAQPG